MKQLIALLAAALLCACGQSAPPAAAPKTGIDISGAWVTPTPGGVTVSAGYLTITNHALEEDRLIGASSERANSVNVHRMSMEDGMMVMRPAGELAIPAGGSLVLAPHALHLMFNDVTAPFAEGETIPVRLHFERGGDIELSLPVRRTAP